jgi:hypothetical protein
MTGMETFIVYCGNHMEHMSTLCGQNGDIKASGTYFGLKGFLSESEIIFGYCIIPLWRCYYSLLDPTESYVAYHALDKHTKPNGTLFVEVRGITYISPVRRPLEAVHFFPSFFLGKGTPS